MKAVVSIPDGNFWVRSSAAHTATVAFNLNVAVNPSVSLTGTPFNGLNTYYIHSDHLDSPRSITNTAGQEVWRWDNTDPFGNNLANENPANLGAFTFNLRFPGQYFDKETGLHYNVNRDYNPANGRYIQSDPIGLRGGINTFGYVGGNPLGKIDPLGLIGVLPGPVPLPIPFPINPPPSPSSSADPFNPPTNSSPRFPAIQVPKWFPSWAKPAQQCKDEQEAKCDKEWRDARKYCGDLYDGGYKPDSAGKGIGGRNYAQCVKGQVTEACGGSRIE